MGAVWKERCEGRLDGGGGLQMGWRRLDGAWGIGSCSLLVEGH